MDLETLVDKHPRLFHMAAAGSWPSISQNGLLTTEEIVNSSRLSRRDKDELLHYRRASSVRIQHPALGEVVVRDQGPLNLSHLEPKLTDLTVEEWLAELNSRVFFWLHPQKLAGLLQARRYRDAEQDVITVDTCSLLDAVGDRAQLSAINSGAALYPNATPRGSGTFTAISDYDYEAQRRKRGAIDAIVELAVLGGVHDLAPHVVEVRRMRGVDTLQRLA